jgi:hypothetical protein
MLCAQKTCKLLLASPVLKLILKMSWAGIRSLNRQQTESGGLRGEGDRYLWA